MHETLEQRKNGAQTLECDIDSYGNDQPIPTCTHLEMTEHINKMVKNHFG